MMFLSQFQLLMMFWKTIFPSPVELIISYTLNSCLFLPFCSHVIYNAALKEFLLSYLAHRERPPLLAKDEQLGLNKTTDALQENIMADFDKRVSHTRLYFVFRIYPNLSLFKMFLTILFVIST